MNATEKACIECGAINARGYGYRPSDGAPICYDCCHKHDLQDMRNGQAIVAYLSSDGRHITNWPGDTLATVTSETKRTLYGCCKSERTFIRARDANGRHWYGQGPGRGMYCRIRRCIKQQGVNP
jgi:hypothetical protein